MTTEEEKFVWEHKDDDPVGLRLRFRGKSLPFDVENAITQIECRQKCSRKLPHLSSLVCFQFPSVLAAEQSTSEVLAQFHASLIPKESHVLDMTCGLGVDDYFISKRAASVLTFDTNPLTAKIAEENFLRLKAHNIKVINEDSIQWLKNHPDERFDMIFADPARRGDHNSRLYALEDTSPDIPFNIELIKAHTDTLYVKMSPMLDIKQVLGTLQCVSRLWVLSVKNECKELFAECRFNESLDKPTEIFAINFPKEEYTPPHPSIVYFTDQKIPADNIWDNEAVNLQGKLVYIPDSSVLKSGLSAVVAERFGLVKLNAFTWIYVSSDYHTDFPGRVFKVNEVYGMSQIKKKILRGERRNIICRNFSLKPSQLAVLSGVKEGSNKDFLIGAAIGNKKKEAVLDCTALS